MGGRVVLYDVWQVWGGNLGGMTRWMHEAGGTGLLV